MSPLKRPRAALWPRPLLRLLRRLPLRLPRPRPRLRLLRPRLPAALVAVAVNAPMPGNILDVRVKPGDSVKAGDTLLILEAMKMENEISAPQDGTIASVNVSKGDTVNSGDLLCSMN